MATRVRTSDFVASSKQYVKTAVDKANKNKNRYLTKAEARALPKDLRDNYKNLGSTSARKLKETFPRYAAANLKRADKDADGEVVGKELRSLPADLRDNAKNFYQATNTLGRVGVKVTETRAQLLGRLERGVARHDWKSLLPLFDKSNRKGQSEIGVNDYQYIAEGLGLHMVGNELPGPVTRASSLDLISKLQINRTPIEVVSSPYPYERYAGTATLKGGRKLQVDVFVKPVAGGFVFDPPVG